jgi:hypothetical protein
MSEKDERVWTVQYGFHGLWGSYPYEVGCVCSKDNATYGLPADHWVPHYHVGGMVYRKPDRVIRQPWDKGDPIPWRGQG